MADEPTERMRELIAELPFRATETVVEDALEVAAEIEAEAEELYERTPEDGDSWGTRAEDEFNSLLAVYDEPRSGQANRGVVAGLEVAVKDVIATQNLRMTCGSKGCDFVPSFDATVVERLLAEGANLVGKANCDAFAFGPTGEFSEFGKVINPAAPDRVPGGSSSGSAAAVKGGVVDIALGTDTGGSIRIPASCCDVVGIKPTHGLVPRYGLADLAPSTDVIGPIAKDVKNAARSLEAISGHDIRDPSSSRVKTDPLHEDIDTDGDVDIAIPESFLDRSSETVCSVVETTARQLSGREEVNVEYVPLEFGRLESAYPLTLATEYAWLLRQAFVIRGEGTQYNWELQSRLDNVDYNDHIALRVLPAAYLDKKTGGHSYTVGRREAKGFEERVDMLLEDFDAMVTPTLRTVPPTYSEVDATEGMENITGNTMPFSLSGHPAVSVPSDQHDEAPVGLQIIAEHFDDKRAIQVAKLVESTCH